MDANPIDDAMTTAIEAVPKYAISFPASDTTPVSLPPTQRLHDLPYQDEHRRLLQRANYVSTGANYRTARHDREEELGD